MTKAVAPSPVVLLHAAAVAIAPDVPDGPDRPLMRRIAATAPHQWTPQMIEYAATKMRENPSFLRSHGVDPSLLPAPGSTWPAPPLAGAAEGQLSAARAQGLAEASKMFDDAQPTADRAAAAPAEPFDYEHTIVGLRGIPITALDSVADRAVEGFEQAGLGTLYDLLMHVPLRYVDRSRRVPIRDLTVGETATTIATVKSAQSGTTRTGMRYARIELVDGTGSLTCTFFNSPWQAKRFKTGDEVVAQGKVTLWENKVGVGTLQMTGPLLDRTGDDHVPIVAVYPQAGTGKDSARARLTTWQIHRAAVEAIDRMGQLSDPIPEPMLTRQGLIDRHTSYRQVHRPDSAGRECAARDRLAYDELLRMQLALRMRSHNLAAQAAVTHTPTGGLTGALRRAFPYPLTGAQERAFNEIQGDLTASRPMHRLLQGDVGAGKTVVAALTLLTAIEGGHQGVLMAPTEILATQLHQELTSLTTDLKTPAGDPIQVDTLTNKVRSKARRSTLAGLADGTVHLVVGTHALLSDDVTFASLGVAVVDEQHRFGVEQRALLRDKGPASAKADMLVMTATPIPRTAAMTVFGDLDVTVLDELPPGRTPISTTWVNHTPDVGDRNDPTWSQLRDHVAAGNQGYVVCPLVEDSETKAAAAATDVAARLANGALMGLRVGLVHGKQKPQDRADVMDKFRGGDLDVLVATTVIEVGVSVPNATMIVVLDPKQFGIAQLHQLRGRVGRGVTASECVLAGEATGDDGTRRMEALCATTDGFALSEIDLELRGPGQILGSTQHGLSDLRVASLTTDTDLMAAARRDATELLRGDPGLLRRPALLAEVHAALGPDGHTWLERG